MGRRLGQLTGIFAIALVLSRLGSLLQTGPEELRWPLILIASVFLGAVIWWLLDQLSLSRPVAIFLMTLGGVVLVLRISVPGTLVAGFLPTLDTLGALADELGEAISNIRFGVPPVLPEPGIVAIVAVVMWSIGALYSWGASGGPVAAMTLPSIIVYLQFAVFDRISPGLGWLIASALMITMAVASVALDRSSETGRARDVNGRALPRRSTATAAAMAGIVGLAAIATTTSASGLVSEFGNIPWRTGGSGYGGLGGGASYEPFVDMQQTLFRPNNILLFQATLGDGAPPPEQIYWRLESLDQWDGERWGRSNTSVSDYDAQEDVGEAHHRYQGTTIETLQRIRIEQLRRDIAPTAGIVTEIYEIPGSEGGIPPRQFRVAPDSSLVYPPRLTEGDIYQLSAIYPDQEADLPLLATGTDGELSPLFQGAVEAGIMDIEPDPRETDTQEPDNLAFYVELPDDMPSALPGIAARETLGAATPYEQAWMLQHWFRDSGEFVYSADVSTGHDALRIEEWLDDPDSENYHVGYCEQFAASMAVLGRILGIPSRVVLGFTPGTVNGGVIEVRDTNAHAWVEMWMECCGWVRFDPTPRGEFLPTSETAGFDPNEFVELQSASGALTQPTQPGENLPESIGITDIEPLSDGSGAGSWWLLVVPALALVASIIPLAKRIRRRRRIQKVREGDITAVWDEIVDRLTDLGEPIPPSMTPIEFARETDPVLMSLATDYSAAVYGGRLGGGSMADLLNAEGWLDSRFDASRRLKAALSPRSFLDRN